MTEQRDRDMDMTGIDTSTGSDTGPDSDRDQSGLGSQPPSGRSGWEGSETSEGEAGSVGQAETGSMGAGGGTGSMAGQMLSGWQGGSGTPEGDQPGGDTVMGGESFEGRARDTGQGGWTTGDSGIGQSAADDGGRAADGSDS